MYLLTAELIFKLFLFLRKHNPSVGWVTSGETILIAHAATL